MPACICRRSPMRCGIEFDLHDVCDIFRAHALHRRPEAGRQVRRQGPLRDRRRARADEGAARGRLPAWRLHDRHRQDHRRKSRKVATSRTTRTWCARPQSPLSPTGGVVGLKGNLAPQGAIVKVAGMKNLAFTGRARCFDCEEDAYRGRRAGASTRKATSWSSATKGRAAARACARCWRPRRPSTARAWATRWR